MSSSQATVIIAAAGQGQRLAATNNSMPKQFIELGGVPIFIWSLTTFLQHPKIKEIVLVAPQPWLEKTRTLLMQYLPEYAKQVTIIAGGKLRQESVYLALEVVAAHNPPPYIFIHDAARPFVTSTFIDQIFVALENGFACTLGIPLSDSVKKVKDTAIIEDMDRSSLALMQTPQAAEFKLMLAAHRSAREKQYVTTDDAALIQAYGVNTRVVPGSRFNLKITEADDMLIAKAFIDSYGWRPGKVNTRVAETIGLN